MPQYPDTTLADELPMVLVASADGPTRISIARITARLGLTSLVAIDGAAAFTAARNHGRSLLCAVLDAHLPTLSGWEVARSLRPMVDGLPLVVLDRGERPAHHSGSAHASIFSADDLSGLSHFLGFLAETMTPAENLA